MDPHVLKTSSDIFKYFYEQGLPKFGPKIAKKLAQIPADYVYQELSKSYPNNCFIDSRCCLKYCNEVLDHEFERFDPDFKRLIYERSSGVHCGNVSQSEINLRLKSKRTLNKMYSRAVNDYYNVLDKSMNTLIISGGKRRNENINLENLKNLRLG